MAGNLEIKNAQGKKVTLQNPDTNGSDIVVDLSAVASSVDLALKANISDVGVANSSYVKTALNASGTAPIYACRAWVNFNGTGTVAIRASGNVSSITDNGTGDYTANFITSMIDSNYAPMTMAVMDGVQFSGVGYFPVYITYKAGSRLVSSVGFLTGYSNQVNTSSRVDSADIAIAIFR